MKSILAALALGLTFGAMPVMAEGEHGAALSYNLSVASEYRYRGISQTHTRPALQGGADYEFGHGFYVGAWASSINWVKEAGGGSNVEIDLFGGYKKEIAKDLLLDVGLLSYVYPSNGLKPSANTLEFYGALTFGPLTAKYSQTTGNVFGFENSKSSGYTELSASFDLGGGYSLVPHIGHQSVKNNSKFDYTDYSIGLTKEHNGLLLSGAIIGADTNAYLGTGNKNLAKSSLVLSVKKTF